MKVTKGNLIKHLKLDSDKAIAIVKLIKTHDSADEAMEAIDVILGTCGVEGVSIEGNYYTGLSYYYTGLSYCNTGETYDLTVAYDSADEEFLLTSWGDWYESNGGLDEGEEEYKD